MIVIQDGVAGHRGVAQRHHRLGEHDADLAGVRQFGQFVSRPGAHHRERGGLREDGDRDQ